jgi:uncharacterized protein
MTALALAAAQAGAPLAETGRLGDGAGLVAAVLIGVAFGWCLERAGMGSARKLAGQFYLTDLTVFKVMFSAILTAMLGAFWLSRLGLLDLSLVYVPETWLAPQLAGGLVFGVGFVVGGLCPGTSCVAAATGRKDGIALAIGMLLGVWLFGEMFGAVQSFYESTPRGRLLLPDVLGVSYGTVVLGVVLLALGGFAGAEWLERRAGARQLQQHLPQRSQRSQRTAPAPSGAGDHSARGATLKHALWLLREARWPPRREELRQSSATSATSAVNAVDVTAESRVPSADEASRVG